MEGNIRVEVLFPEIANLYGDLENIEYIKKSCPDVEVVHSFRRGSRSSGGIVLRADEKIREKDSADNCKNIY